MSKGTDSSISTPSWCERCKFYTPATGRCRGKKNAAKKHEAAFLEARPYCFMIK